MFTVLLFIITMIRKQSKCPSRDKWVKRKWYMYTKKDYLAIKKTEKKT